MKNEKKPNDYPLPRETIKPLGHVDFDPQGSYTGVPADRNDKLVQDADDL